MSQVQVRAACASDLTEVLALEREVAEAPHWTADDYAEIVRGGWALRCLYIADLDGALSGFAVGKVVADQAELESIAVHPAARRNGVGQALCEAVIDWCRLQGAAVLELEVRAGSAGALALYEGLRFVRVGLRRGYYREPADDAVLMRLSLLEGDSG